MTDEPAIRAARNGQDDDAARIAQILVDTFGADNHDTLDAEITRLMLDLSAEVDPQERSPRSQDEERLRMVVKAVLMTLRGDRPISE